MSPQPSHAPQPRLVSADSHVVEPPELFAPVARKFRGTEPKLLHTAERGWVLDTGLGRAFQPGRFATAGLEPDTPAYLEQERSGYARDGLTDVQARLADLDRDGVEAEVVFPTLLGSFVGKQEYELELVLALLRSYNDWLAEYCREAPRRLFPLACVQVQDVDAAVAEVERARRLGHVGIAIPCGSPSERPYSDPGYDALWAAARAEELPIAFHAGFGSDPGSRAEAFARNGLRHTLQHVGAAVTASDLVLGGVCERFPGLRFVCTEFGTGWIAHFLARMDAYQLRHGDRGRERFSDCWRRSFAATFEGDAIGIRTRAEIGVESLLWANDYPHGDSIWPRSRNTLDRILAECSAEERRALCAGNATRIYRLPLPE
jgi:predicted TIM-barrel fold metal-dependent hydrolase